MHYKDRIKTPRFLHGFYAHSRLITAYLCLMLYAWRIRGDFMNAFLIIAIIAIGAGGYLLCQALDRYLGQGGFRYHK